MLNLRPARRRTPRPVKSKLSQIGSEHRRYTCSRGCLQRGDSICIVYASTATAEDRSARCPVVPSVASSLPMQPKESRLAIRRNPQNEIASSWAVKARKLAISNLVSPGKSTPTQCLECYSRTTIWHDDRRSALPFPLREGTPAEAIPLGRWPMDSGDDPHCWLRSS